MQTGPGGRTTLENMLEGLLSTFDAQQLQKMMEMSSRMRGGCVPSLAAYELNVFAACLCRSNTSSTL